jgi:hypothetical protein
MEQISVPPQSHEDLDHVAARTAGCQKDYADFRHYHWILDAETDG